MKYVTDNVENTVEKEKMLTTSIFSFLSNVLTLSQTTNFRVFQIERLYRRQF